MNAVLIEIVTLSEALSNDQLMEQLNSAYQEYSETPEDDKYAQIVAKGRILMLSQAISLNIVGMSYKEKLKTIQRMDYLRHFEKHKN